MKIIPPIPELLVTDFYLQQQQQQQQQRSVIC